MKTPIIAITACSKLPDYEAAVRLSGGSPRVVRPGIDPIETVLQEVDGVLLSGGGDVAPAIYGEAVHPSFDAAEPGRDAFEIELARRATEARVPVLAICRGVQVLNVARGGSLIQDIAAQFGTLVNHRVVSAPDTVAHTVTIAPGSLLARALGDHARAATCDVNSRHHQGIKTPGRGLVVTARSSDGMIEALEDPDQRFCLGVQWHPENFYRTGEFRTLFDAFVTACGKRA